ncbi:ATP-binding protein [Sphingobium scionense]
MVGWTDTVEASWREIENDYPLCFDWDFVPAWIIDHIDWSDPFHPALIQREGDEGSCGGELVSARQEPHPMSFPVTIRPEVGQSLITKVSRLFNGTLGDVLLELFQNARRAGARAIHVAVYNLPAGTALSIYDDGCGIDDPANLLTLGTSGWQQDIRDREDPAGMGVFSLAYRDVIVRSRSRAAGRGWAVHIPADGWEGTVPLAIASCGIVRGTEIQIMLPTAWEEQLGSELRIAARYFPIPVHFEGAQLPCEDFLAGAAQIELWEGCRIGIFHDGTTEAVHTPGSIFTA